MRRLWRAGLLVLGALLAVFAIGVLWPLRLPTPPADRSPLAVHSVTVLDVETGEARPGQTILIVDGRIIALGADEHTPVPDGTRRIDGTGLWAIPALWDMHVHITAITPWLDLPLFVASGVTHVRDMLGCPSAGDPFIACPRDKQALTAEVRRGERVGPRIEGSASFMANGPITLDRVRGVPPWFGVRTPDEARRFVQHAHREGASFVKVYDRLPLDAWDALVAESDRLGLPVVGHRPYVISAEQAAAGMRSLEHARFLLHEGWAGADSVREAVRQGAAFREDRRLLVDAHDSRRSARVFEVMRTHRTAYVPTHLTRWADAFADDPTVLADTLLQFVHPLLVWQWREDLDALVTADTTAAGRQAYRDFHTAGLALTRDAHASGVQVLAGTDYLVGGPTLHRELELLVAAGLSPMDALRAATIEPARWFGREDAGRLVVGAEADVLLLQGDPRIDIRNAARIHTVIMDGRVYDQAQLTSLRDHVRASARSWTIGAKILWRFVKHPANY